MGLISNEGKKYSLLHNVQSSSGTSPPTLLYSGHRVSLPGVKRPGRVGELTDGCPISAAEVKNEWSHTSAPLRMFSWRGREQLYFCHSSDNANDILFNSVNRTRS